MMRWQHAWIVLCCIVVIPAGCGGSSRTAGESSRMPLTETEAIRMAMDARSNESDHFPLQPGMTKVKESGVGKPGTTITVEWTTRASMSAPNQFIVTLVKDWNVRIGDRKVISRWTYEVDADAATLVESEDHDNRVALIKRLGAAIYTYTVKDRLRSTS